MVAGRSVVAREPLDLTIVLAVANLLDWRWPAGVVLESAVLRRYPYAGGMRGSSADRIGRC